jgi:small-conductance mechanosensitive channel
MNELVQAGRDFLTSEAGLDLVRAVLLFVVGLVVARLAGAAVRRVLRDREPSHRILARRVVVYSIVVLFALTALRHAGFDLGILLGAAGILTVALGFASQTSVSNVISGLFLIGENAFSVGETITVDGVTGDVLSIDWLSVKLRTFDNLYVRLPNEMMLKAQITNLTRFPIRRLDTPFRVDQRHDPERIRSLLVAVADRNPLCLDEPEPLFLHLGFADGAVNLQFSVWFLRENLIPVRNSFLAEMRAELAAEGIEIALPRRAVSLEAAGEAAELSEAAEVAEEDLEA